MVHHVVTAESKEPEVEQEDDAEITFENRNKESGTVKLDEGNATESIALDEEESRGDRDSYKYNTHDEIKMTNESKQNSKIRNPLTRINRTQNSKDDI